MSTASGIVTPGGASPDGVIHDIGYRPYTGPRKAEAHIARSLLTSSYKNAFGWGRSMQSKMLPSIVLAIYTLPAIIQVAVAVISKQLTQEEMLWIRYPDYATGVGFFTVAVFAAAQAPALFSRDQRCGSIALYLSRPLRSFIYVLMRWLGLVLALLTVISLPLIVMGIGSVLAGLDKSDQLKGVAQGVALGVVLAALLAALTGLVSSWSTKKGFAVVISMMTLMVSAGIAGAFYAVASQEDMRALLRVAMMLSPATLYQALVQTLAPAPDPIEGLTDPSANLGGTGMGLVYLLVAGSIVGVCLLLLRLHYRKVASR